MPKRNTPQYFEIRDFSGGWDNVSKPTTLSPRTFTDLKNWNITRHKGLEKRKGMEKLYSTTAGASVDIKNLYEYKAPNGTNYVLVATGTKIRAYYNAQWNDLKTSLTTGKKYSFLTHRGLCYGVNGLDDNFKFYNTTSYAVGLTPPTAAPLCAATAVGGTGDLTETHPTGSADRTGQLRNTSAETLIAQSFKLPYAVNLSKVTLKMRKVGTPSGGTPAIWVEIHSAQDGTSETKNDSDHIVTASSASATVNPATGLTTAFADVDFTFATAPICLADTTYYIVVYGDFTVSTTNFVEVGFDNDEPSYEDGLYFTIGAGATYAWTEVPNIDLVFEVYGTATESSSLASYGAVETGSSESMKTSTYYALAQGFQVTAACDVYKVKVAIKRAYWSGWSSETIWAEIHSSATGTSFTKNASTNIVGQASTSVAVDSIGTSFSWETFTFDGTKPTLTASTTYYLVLFTDATESSTYTIDWTADDTGYSSGIPYGIESDLTWGAETNDFSFDIWGAATTAASHESYALTNVKDYKNLRETNSQQMIAQAFVAPQTGDCTKVDLYLSQTGTVAGSKTIWLEIHDGQDGTSASQDGSTRINGTYATASATPDAISAFPTFDTVTFTFSGTDPSLVEGTTYYLVLYGSYDVSSTNYIHIQTDKVSPTYTDGNLWNIDTSEAWTEYPNTCLTFALYQADSGLTGTYKYKYTYKRNGFIPIESNPSDPCTAVTPSGQGVNVGVIASTDTQVDDIIIYRTKASGEVYYKVTELGANSAATYKDTFADAELTTEVDVDNNVPPKAKFLVLHKDRVVYMNCPEEDEGDSLVMWSKSGYGEQVPTANYQYFDKDDGEEITGGASLGDYLLVFKRNKIGILAGELDSESEIWYLDYGMGCISGHAILTFKDKIVFLSEEGWKATDGKNIWSISTAIDGLVADGYFVADEKENYSAAYYPEKEQYMFLANHSSLQDKIFIGHFLVPLLLEGMGADELKIGELVSWTYHQYDNDELTCIGTYTDSSGLTKVIAGAYDGFVYELDSGTDDDGSNIGCIMETDWLTLGTTLGDSKTIRRGYIGWTAATSASATFVTDIDYAQTEDSKTITNDSTGTDDGNTSKITMKGTGKVFRFRFEESSNDTIGLSMIAIYFRSIGLR